MAPTGPSPTANSSPPGPTTLPAAARQRTRAGAVAFVKHFLTEYNRAVTTPMTGLLPPLSLPACGTCDGLEGHARWLAKNAYRFSAAPVRTDLVHGVGSNSGTEVVASDPAFFVDVLPQQRAVDVTDRRGRPVKQLPAERGTLDFELRWTTSGWRAAKIKVLIE